MVAVHRGWCELRRERVVHRPVPRERALGGCIWISGKRHTGFRWCWKKPVEVERDPWRPSGGPFPFVPKGGPSGGPSSPVPRSVEGGEPVCRPGQAPDRQRMRYRRFGTGGRGATGRRSVHDQALAPGLGLFEFLALDHRSRFDLRLHRSLFGGLLRIDEEPALFVEMKGDVDR